MDYKLLIIPGVVIVLGVLFMVFMSARGSRSVGKAQERMKEFAVQEYPCLRGTPFSVINLLEDASNAQHIWVVAYDQGGMRLIPTTLNPYTQTLTKYVDVTPLFNWKKQLAANLFAGNKSEENEYIPYSAITSASVDENRKRVSLQLGEVRKSFRYQMKDCFGAPQDETLSAFFRYLKSI